jgi:hypothetical protein
LYYYLFAVNTTANFLLAFLLHYMCHTHGHDEEVYKMKIVGKALLMFCSLYSSYVAAQNLQCPDIARTLKTYQIDASSSSFLNSAFSQNCQQDGSRKSSGGGVGLEAIVKAIPVKFTGNYNSTDEGFTNFCKSYASLATATSSQDAYKEFISDKALITIEQCNRLQASGVQITHDVINIESVVFYLRSSVTQSFDIQGVSTTGKVACTGLIKGRPTKFDNNVSVSVKATQNISCIRKGEASQKGPIFDEASVTVLTNQGNYSVLLPRDERLSETLASSIAAQISTLRKDLAASNTLLRVVTDAKAIPIYQCPVGWVKGGPPGQWASYGCQGHISAIPTCTDNVYPQSQTLPCAPLGSVRPY